MLLGQLPDLRETQSDKDLVAIGRVEGKTEGKSLSLAISHFRHWRLNSYCESPGKPVTSTIRKLSTVLVHCHGGRSYNIETGG